MMNRVVLAALSAALCLGVAAPAFADAYDEAVTGQIHKYLSYPEAAIDAQLEGSVDVSLNIDAQGHVASLTLDDRSGERTLDLATIRAVRHWAASYSGASGEAPHTIHLRVSYQLS